MREITKEEYDSLNAEYRAVFGDDIPTMELPADADAAIALIREAIEKRDDSVFERDLPKGAVF
jgi:predicted TIM-barrel fold metal-dependent hydrolase